VAILEKLFDMYFEEDCPYFDETCELLGIEGTGRMEIISRTGGIAACTEELGEYLRSKGLKVHYVRSGESFKEGEKVFLAEGELRKLFLYWRVSQTFLSITCAVATKTRELVDMAKAVNPGVIVATTRKTHPGMRYFELKAVMAGGGNIHRNSLSDSILVTPNHIRVVGDRVFSIKSRSLKPVEIEPGKGEADKFAGISDLILLDHYTPEELKSVVPELKKKNPGLKVAVAGNIGDNIAEYARYADVIVTSAPYYARPLDMTCRIERN